MGNGILPGLDDDESQWPKQKLATVPQEQGGPTTFASPADGDYMKRWRQFHKDYYEMAPWEADLALQSLMNGSVQIDELDPRLQQLANELMKTQKTNLSMMDSM